MFTFFEKIHSRIAYKLSLWIIVFSSVVTLFATALQLYFDYEQDLQYIKDYFISVSKIQLRSISQSVWILDDNQIQAQLDGITQGRDIIYTAIIVDGKPHWQSGSNTAERTYGVKYNLHYYQREIDYQPGELQIVASLDGVYQRLKKRAIVILLTNALKTFFFAAGALMLFQFAVTRHLEKIASYVVRMDFRNRIAPLQLDRRSSKIQDEFSQVISMLNIFQRRGYNAFKTLEKSEQRLRLFFDATEEGILGINREERITFVNSACLKMIGVDDHHAIIGKKIDEIIHYSFPGDSLLKAKNIFTRPMETMKSMRSEDGRILAAGRISFYASVLSYPILLDDKCSGAIVFFNDISEQREIVREKNLLRQTVRQSPILIVITDNSGQIEYVNPGFEKITGYSLKEAAGRKPFFLGRKCDNSLTYRGIRSSIKEGKRWQGRYDILARNGVKYCLDAVVTPVINEEGVIINLIGVFLDITQKLELQKQLNHAQKMEAVGRLSASFAHEFGNPLLGVRSVIGDICERVPMSADDKYLLRLAYGECERMKALIRDFQKFQRMGSGKKETYSIHDCLDNVLLLYRNRLAANEIQLEKNFAAELPLVHIRKDQISQVFLNLILNAVDAMKENGGLLTIATSKRSGSVYIEIRDSGIGIAERDKELIFEPFYTTKHEVEGIGLGLSISYGIVSSHGGEISVRSRLNRGSIFTVRLPLQPLKN